MRDLNICEALLIDFITLKALSESKKSLPEIINSVNTTTKRTFKESGINLDICVKNSVLKFVKRRKVEMYSTSNTKEYVLKKDCIVQLLTSTAERILFEDEFDMLSEYDFYKEEIMSLIDNSEEY